MRKVILLFSIVACIVLYTNFVLFEKPETFRLKEEVLREKEDKDIVGEPLSREEINSFMNVWGDYKNSWVGNLGIRQLSLTTSDSQAKKVPYITRAWINRKGWEVDRFFYVEERLKAIVISLSVEDRAKKTVDVLEKQYKLEKNQANKDNIKRLIDYQKQLLNIEKVSKKERDMVRPYLQDIAELLSEQEEG